MYMLHNFYYVNNVIISHIQTSVAQIAKASGCPYHVQHKLWKPSRSHPMPKLQKMCKWVSPYKYYHIHHHSMHRGNYPSHTLL